MNLNSSQKIALFDWDETLRRGITLLPWVRYLYENSYIKRSSFERIRKLFVIYGSCRLSYEDFAINVVQEYAMALRGNSSQLLDELAEKFVEVDKVNLSIFTRSLIELMNSNKILVVLVSGCPDTVLKAYTKILKIDVIFGLSINENDGYFTGVIQKNPSVLAAKEEIVEDIRVKREIVLAAGNSNSDFPLFKHAKLSLAVKTENHSLSKEVLKHAYLLNEFDVLPFIHKHFNNF